MTGNCSNRTRCPFWHEFDGHCCPEPLTCLYDEHPRPQRVAITPLMHEQVASRTLATWAVLCATAAILILYTCVRMERHYAEIDGPIVEARQ